jgi:hypothetical protein
MCAFGETTVSPGAITRIGPGAAGPTRTCSMRLSVVSQRTSAFHRPDQPR